MVNQPGPRIGPLETVEDIHNACRALRQAIHPDAIVLAAIASGSYRGEDPVVTVKVHPLGYTDKHGPLCAPFEVRAATWEEAFVKAIDHWGSLVRSATAIVEAHRNANPTGESA